MTTVETTCGILEWETVDMGRETWVYATFHQPERAKAAGLCQHWGPDNCEALQAFGANPHTGKWNFVGESAAAQFLKALERITPKEKP